MGGERLVGRSKEEGEHVLDVSGRGGASVWRDSGEVGGSHNDPLIGGGWYSKGEDVVRRHVTRRR